MNYYGNSLTLVPDPRARSWITLVIRFHQLGINFHISVVIYHPLFIRTKRIWWITGGYPLHKVQDIVFLAMCVNDAQPYVAIYMEIIITARAVVTWSWFSHLMVWNVFKIYWYSYHQLLHAVNINEMSGIHHLRSAGGSYGPCALMDQLKPSS